MTRVIPIPVTEIKTIYRPVWWFRDIPYKMILVWEWEKELEVEA